MSTLSDLVARHSRLDPADADWLHLLVGDWQLISDLAFADLVLWLPMAGGDFIAIAQCRPTTGATVNYDDIVGTTATEGLRVHLGHALAEAKIQRVRESRMIEGSVVREEVVPVTRTGRPFAVVARQTNLGSSRTPSRLELNYVGAADELLRMVAHGEFPSPDSPTGPRRGAPRVGDGLIRLNAEGDVLYASPNASSCFHRLGVVGNLVGESLIELTTELIVQNSPVDETLPLVVMGRAPWRTDLEKKGVTIALRAVPLTEGRRRTGAILVCRDVS
ncbi:MAG TPA: histidine kinase N-terminal domain-containing protein, partial [Cellulomonas sp.]